MSLLHCRNCGHNFDVPKYHGPLLIVCPKCDWHEALPAQRQLPKTWESQTEAFYQALKDVEAKAGTLVEHCREMQPGEFEQFCADLFTQLEFNVTLVDQASDDSHSLELMHGESIIYVTCRGYKENHPVRHEAVENLAGIMRARDIEKGMFVTTSSFPESCAEIAKEAGIALMDAPALQEKIESVGVAQLAQWLPESEAES